MVSFYLRKASPDDAPQLARIYSYYVLNTAVSYEYAPPSTEEFERRIEETLRKYPYLVAEDKEGIVGYAYAGPFNTRAAADWCAEVSIYVDRDRRKKGIGRALYAKLEELLGAMNYRSLVAKVACCDREDEYLSRDSVLFHRKCGYKPVGKVENCGYKFGHWYGLMFMEKELCPPEAPVMPLTHFSEL